MSYGVNLNQAQAGKQSVGAVATEKYPSDALNLGFPSAYQSVYAAKQKAPRYFPEVYDGQRGTFWKGSDLQCEIHEQRRKDAHFMAGAKVRATQLSRVRYVGTPHGRGVLPHAVLSQRRFANPSNGALEPASGRQDQIGPFHFSTSVANTVSQHGALSRKAEGFHQDPLVGGVLRTMVGQQHGRKLLNARVQQLNEIQLAKQAFQAGPTGLPTASAAVQRAQTTTPIVGENAAIELNLLLQGVIDAVVGGETSVDAAGQPTETSIDHLSTFTMKDATRALSLIFRLSPMMDGSELDDTYGKIDLIMNGVDAILDPKEETTLSSQTREIALTLQVLFTKLRVYVEKMIEGRNLSQPEKVALSRALVNSLGFSKMLKYTDENYRGMLKEADKDKLMTAQQSQRYRVGDMGVDGDGSSWGDDDDDFFSRPAGPREDEEHAASTGKSRSARDFTPDVRQEFGTQSGMFFPNNGRGLREWFGEPQFVGQPYEIIGDVTTNTVPPPPPAPESLPMEARPPPPRAPTDPSRRTQTPQVSGFWDPDTQGFNVGSVGLPPSESQPSKRHSAPRPPSAHSPSTRAPSARSARATPTPSFSVPKTQSELPKTKYGFQLLSQQLKDAGGPVIRVNQGSTLQNVRKNFILRLGLAGKK
jgi:hypothetical protein